MLVPDLKKNLTPDPSLPTLSLTTPALPTPALPTPSLPALPTPSALPSLYESVTFERLPDLFQ